MKELLKKTWDKVRVALILAIELPVMLCDQIKTVDTRRLDKCCGHVTDEEMAQIDDAIRRVLGLEEEAPRNAYDPKLWRAMETDRQLLEQLAEAKEQAESWRRMALHLMERSA